VYSPFSNFKNAENVLKDRSDVEETGESSLLVIDNLLSTDDGNYRCEITYLDVSSACQSVFQHTLTTTALPKSVILSVGEEPLIEVDRDSLGDHTNVAGPYMVDTEVEFVCEVKEVKPDATIIWTLSGTEVEAGDVEQEELDGGSLNVVSRLTVKLEREFLASDVACSVHFQDSIVAKLSVELDLTVPPESVDLEVEAEMSSGQESHAICTVSKAKPAAYPRWEGLEDIDTMEDLQEVVEDDSTVTVTSTLTFTPTSDQHDILLSCIVETGEPMDVQIEQSELLSVKFGPEVDLAWDNSTLFEGDQVELRCPYRANPANSSTLTWFLNGEPIVESEDANLDVNEDNEDVLVLESVDRNWSGEYNCKVENTIGVGISNTVLLDIWYVADVELSLHVDEPMIEGATENATLICSLVDGNPFVMDKVLWLLDTPDHESIEIEEDCGESVCELQLDGMRTESGNWSCQAINSAGRSPHADTKYLQVYYTASEGTVENDDMFAMKGGNYSLTCQLEHMGFPPIESYAWTRNDEVVEGEDGMILFLEELSVESESNYSCTGVNSAGTNFGESFFLDVFVGPTFIETPEPEVVMEDDYQWVNLTCQVECSPFCNVEWFRNMEKIEGGDMYRALLKSSDNTELFRDYEVMISTAVDPEDENGEDELKLLVGEEMIGDEEDMGEIFFLVNVEARQPDSENNQFESIVSTLSIQLGNLTSDVIHTFQHSNFTCMARQVELADDHADDTDESTADEENVEYDEETDYAHEISATTMLVVQHMPLEMDIDIPAGIDLEDDSVTMLEGDSFDAFSCGSIAEPAASVEWMKDDSEVVSNDERLQLSQPIQRDDAGLYTCTATNRHGSLSQSIFVHVQYTPECSVTFEERDDVLELKCIAVGYPEDFMFGWRHNSKFLHGETQDDFNLLSLSKATVNVSMLSDYKCFVNNTIGQSEACRLPASGFFTENPVLLFAIVAGVVVGLLILLLLVWFLCCRETANAAGSGKGGDGPEKGKSNSKQPHPDNAFYDNLPFHGLKNPPKQVLNSVDDNMVYADVDASEIYSYGPLAYKTASLQRAKKKKLEESKL